MRCGLILVLLAIALVVVGGQGIREAHAFTKPVDITCEQFIKSPPQEGWYRIKGCVMEVDEAAFSVMTLHSSEMTTKEGDPVITEVYLPVHTATFLKEKTDTETPTNLVVKTDDAAVIDTVKQLKRLDKQKPEEVEKWMVKNLQKLLLHKDVTGMVETGINSSETTRDEIAKLQSSLAPGYVIIEEGKTPSMAGSIGMVGGGILMGIISLIYWAAYLLRFVKT